MQPVNYGHSTSEDVAFLFDNISLFDEEVELKIRYICDVVFISAGADNAFVNFVMHLPTELSSTKTLEKTCYTCWFIVQGVFKDLDEVFWPFLTESAGQSRLDPQLRKVKDK